MTSYIWDEKTRQYKTKRGKAVAVAAILAMRDAVSDQTSAEARAITTDYLTAQASLTDWADRFAALVRDAVLAGYLLGRGGAQAVTTADDARLAPALDPQMTAAKDFTAVLAVAPKPMVDDSGVVIDPSTLSIDENGDVVDENGDPVMVNGSPLTEGDLGALGASWDAMTGILARAGSYGSAAIAGFSAGQASSWGVDPPEVPPAHQNCRCASDYSTDVDGMILFQWVAASDACAICVDLADQYTDWPTGVYDNGNAPSGEGGE